MLITSLDELLEESLQKLLEQYMEFFGQMHARILVGILGRIHGAVFVNFLWRIFERNHGSIAGRTLEFSDDFLKRFSEISLVNFLNEYLSTYLEESSEVISSGNHARIPERNS